jgi:hypothetical protein
MGENNILEVRKLRYIVAMKCIPIQEITYGISEL